jgi:hypothetical protein
MPVIRRYGISFVQCVMDNAEHPFVAVLPVRIDLGTLFVRPSEADANDSTIAEDLLVPDVLIADAE